MRRDWQRLVRLATDATAALVCAAAASVVLVDLHGAVRPGLVLAALVLGVGWALTGWMRLGEPAYAGAVALAAGLAFLILVSLLCLEIGWWHPVGLSVGLLVGASALNVVHALRDRVITP